MGSRIWVAALIVIGIGGGVAQAQTTLGTDATAFDLLSTGGKVILDKLAEAGLNGNSSDQGMVGGTSAILKTGAKAFNDVVTDPGALHLHKNATALGCITSGAPITLAAGATCVNLNDNGGQRVELTTMANAISEAGTFAGVADAQTAEETLAAIDVPKKGNATITNDNSSAGLHIKSIPSIALKKDASLTLAGQGGDSDIFQIGGNLKWGRRASLTSSGLTVSGNLIMVVSGKLVSLGKDSQLEATIIAPNATCTLGAHAQLFGALICGKKISLGANAQVIYVPTTVSIP